MQRAQPESIRPAAPALVAFALCALPAWGLAACARRPGAERVEAWTVADAARSAREADRIVRGAAAFDRYCAVCHGELGRGDGPASPFLFPAARDFSSARFRLVSTANGVPGEADLLATLRRGMPGSAMPSWAWLPDATLEALAAYVRHLTIEGLATELFVEGRLGGRTLDAEQALEEARARLVPGAPLPVVEERTPDGALLARGAVLYERNCAACHGEDLTGSVEPRYDEDGSLNWARDLTAGFLKGGDSAGALGHRVLAGLPGSAMPATQLSVEDATALVAFLRTRIPFGLDQRLVHRRETVRAYRVDAVPAEPDDPRWPDAGDAADDAARGETTVVLAPLSWPRRGPATTEAYLAAFHDGETLAIRVRWADASGDLSLEADLTRPDGVALQFSAEEAPPLFGMGSPARPTNLWHWQALRLEEVVGALDVLSRVPHAVAHAFRGEARVDAPLYHPSAAHPGPSHTARELEGRGVGSARSDPRTDGAAARVEVRPLWRDGHWSVVFLRALAARGEGEVRFAPGEASHLALAVWNGARGDRGGRKSISIWQALELEP